MDKEQIVDEITKFMEGTLDYAQLVCPGDHWKPLRSKILRLGNNCIRNIKGEEHGDYQD